MELHQDALRLGRERRTALEAEPLYLALLAEARLLGGDVRGARSAAEEGTSIGKRIGTRVFELEAQDTLARVLMQDRGIADGAEVRRVLDRADALVEQTGAQGKRAWLHLRRAELARLEGEESHRRRELAAARAIFQRMETDARVQEIDQER